MLSRKTAKSCSAMAVAFPIIMFERGGEMDLALAIYFGTLEFMTSFLGKTTALVIHKDFLAPLSASLAGAGVGAWSAHWLAIGSASKGRVIDELRAINSAIAATVQSLEQVANFKNQLLTPTLLQLHDARQKFVEFHRIPEYLRPANRVFRYDFYHPFFEQPFFASEASRAKSIASTSLHPLAYRLSFMVSSELAGIQRYTVKYNELCEDHKKRQWNNALEKLEYTLGVTFTEGDFDESFPGSLEALSVKVEGALWYSHALVKLLVKRGQKLMQDHKRLTEKQGISVWEPTYLAKVLEAMPTDEDFTNFARELNKALGTEVKGVGLNRRAE